MGGQLPGGTDGRPVLANALGACQAGLGTSGQQRHVAPTRSRNLPYIAHLSTVLRASKAPVQSRKVAAKAEHPAKAEHAPAKRRQGRLGAVALP